MAEGRRFKRKRNLLALGLAVVVAGAAGYQATIARGEPEPGTPREGEVLEVGVLTVSLPGDNPHYARVGVAVVLSEGVPAAEVEGRFPLVKDATILVVSSFTAEELRSSRGLERLRSELTREVQGIYPDGEVLRAVLVEALVN